jgi:enamine deaminase RidA (YjgF/YER057c/UK114 family)
MWPDLRESPASTGIGMETRRVAFEAMALEADSNEAAVTWIDNPLQTPPYDYEGQGKPSDNPSFSRAAAVRFADNAVLFVSGTASIRGSEVVCVDDLEAQTRATIENISTLIGTENLARYGFSQGATLENMQQLRVYVKRREGYDVVRSCCEGHFPGVPCTYLVGDVCRPECLVELEGLLETRV